MTLADFHLTKKVIASVNLTRSTNFFSHVCFPLQKIKGIWNLKNSNKIVLKFTSPLIRNTKSVFDTTFNTCLKIRDHAKIYNIVIIYSFLLHFERALGGTNI